MKSPDHPTLAMPANPTAKLPAFNLTRSGGFEGLAQSKDGSKLYGLLEGALFNEDGTQEMVDGNPALRIVEFDVAKQALDRPHLALSASPTAATRSATST